MEAVRLAGRAALGPRAALAWGTLVVGSLDILEVMVFVGVRGVPPVRVLQSVASGLLGRAAYAGGAATAALGLALHFLIALCVVAAYHAASRRVETLRRRPLAWGPVYGVAVWAFMEGVVVPLSAAVLGPPSPAATANQVLVHALFVGLPAALFAAAASRSP